jgi:cytosine/adenosine deaminase-related metal-dependent hydrolase
MLLARVGYGPAAMTAREALELATLGGASVLGRDDIGVLEPGKAADIVGFDITGIAHAGGWHDKVAALVFCQPVGVSFSLINGRIIVADGHLATLDLPVHLERHRNLSAQIARGESG